MCGSVTQIFSLFNNGSHGFTRMNNKKRSLTGYLYNTTNNSNLFLIKGTACTKLT